MIDDQEAVIIEAGEFEMPQTVCIAQKIGRKKAEEMIARLQKLRNNLDKDEVICDNKDDGEIQILE